MPKAGSIIGQITEELGEMGKQVVTETAKVPGDVAGTLLESFGSSSSPKGRQMPPSHAKVPETQDAGPWNTIDTMKDPKQKAQSARSALSQFSQKPERRKPSIWEQIQMEVQQKKEQEKEQKEMQNKALPKLSYKKPPGNLYGIGAKQTSTERKNTRND